MRRIGWLDLVPETDSGAQGRVTTVLQGLEKPALLVRADEVIE
jgi:hypothetical protein